ncbi:S41 family peptidase [Streptomyces gamaensis]|uniref:S41 family peptidase n=1 Tax=Streptomyces gamaensis TaxID=1763542 RepID=A0ABW0Z4F9_9ACTN
MPDPARSFPPGPARPSSSRGRRARRGAALTLVFAGVLATGAAAGAWAPAAGHPGRRPTEAPAPETGHAVGAAPGVDARTAGLRALEAAAARTAGEADASAPEDGAGTDRWSTVYSAREYEGFERALDGAYIGVGLSLRRGAGGSTLVDSVREGSPAARAGVRAGDRLRALDGVPVDGRPVTEVVARLRGDPEPPEGPGGRPLTAPGPAIPGTPVRLGLERAGRGWERTVYRERLTSESVAVERLRGTAGGPPATRIKVSSFTRGTGERVRRAVREAAPGEGVLLDLRGNSGGLVSEAVTAASAFLDGGPVATYDVHGRQRVLRAVPGGATGPPLVVLVDGGTMSAAELLTGALQDRGRAVVVGSRTFGKGSVQMPSLLPDGSVAELTVGHYRTPAGHAVDGHGIVPDVPVRGDAEQRAREVLTGLGTGS